MTKFFPWQLFRKVYFFYFVLLTFVVVGVAAILWGSDFGQVEPWDQHMLSAKSVVVFAILNFLGSMLIGLWLVLSFLLPLRQAILKVRSIANKKFRKSLEAMNLEDIKIEELGEFSELEVQLNEIYRKMRSKNDKIAREKEELKALMSSITDSILAVDIDRKLLFCNDRYRSFFLSEEVKKGQTALADLQSHPAVAAAFEQTLDEKKAAHLEIEVTVEDGRQREFDVDIAPLFRRKTGEQVYGAIAVFHDLTEAKMTKQIKSDFVANASHELRTPLTSLKGYVGTLKEDIRSERYEDTERFVNIIAGNVDRLIDLTNDLLTISRLENGASTLKKEILVPEEINSQLQRDVADLLSASEHQLEFEIIDVPQFRADTLKVQQVVFNLVTNAIKYMVDPGKIQVKWSRLESDVILSVTDNGPGIGAEHLSRIFERFYRIDKGRARTSGGTGLGLAIVKHIAVSHGGNVEVQSEIGEGTSFRVTFPASIVEAVTAMDQNQVEHETTEPQLSL